MSAEIVSFAGLFRHEAGNDTVYFPSTNAGLTVSLQSSLSCSVHREASGPLAKPEKFAQYSPPSGWKIVHSTLVSPSTQFFDDGASGLTTDVARVIVPPT